ncbi:unnamed protein product [Chilo suppressalis]|uniref:Farnesoic acid O-methyl transferase domain-containing protein n=1 Tax=Chilo suppressalis TaxID=168631 RepID=A0ABN8B6W5_CHISP|nr:unnamed protein product [Chilo suppressalis]
MSRHPPNSHSSGKKPPPYYANSYWCPQPSRLPLHPPPYSAAKPHHHSHTTAYPYYMTGTVMVPVPLGNNPPHADPSAQPTYVTNYIYSGESASGSQVKVVQSSEDFDWISTTAATAHKLNGKAVLGGNEVQSSNALWVIRSWYCGDLIPGKLSVKSNNASVPYGGKEITVHNFEVLCAKPENLKWVGASEGNVPPGAIVGGHTANGETLYVGRATYAGGFRNYNIPGKVHQSHQCCYIGVAGKEVSKTTYEVLTRI